MNPQQVRRTHEFSMKLRTLTLLSLSILIFAGAGCKKKTPAPLPPTTPKVEPAKERQGPPTVISFTAEPSTVLRGESTTLRWNVMGASEIVIDSGVGAVDATGTRRVTPAGNTTYNLVAKGPGGTANAAVQVVVTTPPPPPPPVVQPTTPTKSLQERLSTDVQDIYFDYDKSEVREDARATLQRNVEGLRAILRDFPNAVISVEGHCDERGSRRVQPGFGRPALDVGQGVFDSGRRFGRPPAYDQLRQRKAAVHRRKRVVLAEEPASSFRRTVGN